MAYKGYIHLLDADGNMRCAGCKEYKPTSEYNRNKGTRDGFEAECKICRKRYYTPERTRKQRMKRIYGITIEDYQQLFEKQGGVCAICGGKETDPRKGTFCIDHDHKTKKVRGLLCTSCNIGLGYFKDDINSLKMAVKYLT